METNRLFHVSENPNIEKFYTRPTPSFYEEIKGDVVFAANGKFLHNYYFPRDCPRISFYKKANTSVEDLSKFLGITNAEYVITVESSWFETIKNTKLYVYEFPIDNFILLDEGAGYFISYEPVVPVSVREINDLPGELLLRNVELRFTPNLWKLAEELESSSLNFSMIRMRNALPRI